LDGVLIDSKKNMNFAWNQTSKIHDLNIPFSKYFKLIGRSFPEILKNLKIKKNYKYISNTYKQFSKKKINQIKTYPFLHNSINYLKTRNIKIAIVTSKDRLRSIKILKKINLKVNVLYCPTNRLRGKPSPDLLLATLKKIKIKKKEAVFVGDTYIDKKAASSAGIDFLFAKYGYKIGISKSKFSIKNLMEVNKYI